MAQEDLPVSQDDENSEAPPQTTPTITAQISKSYSGPLPPASELAEYNNVLPGAADRIISMAESYARHHQSLETEAMRLEGREQRWARYIAAGVVLAVLATCIVSLFLDKEDFAISLGSSTIVALAAVFIVGKVPEWIRTWWP